MALCCADTSALTIENDGANLKFVMYDTSNGLPSAPANTVAQTSDGFIWIGSYSGLIRYDGTTFYRFDPSVGISNVISLYADSKDRLWIGTNDSGLAVYEQGKFRFYTREDGLPSSAVRAISEDGNGNIIVGTTRGLSYIGADSKLRLLSNAVTYSSYISELRSADGNVFGCTKDGGVFEIEDLKVIHYYGSDAFDDPVQSICPDPVREECLYIGTLDNEILLVNMKDLSVIRRISTGEYSSVQHMEPADGILWVCFDDGIGYVTDSGIFSDINGLPMNNSIDHALRDYEGNMWFASSRQGLMKIVTSRFINLNEVADLPPLVVNSTCLYNDDLYIGTDSGLVILNKNYRKLTNSLTKLLEDQRIRSIKRDSSGGLWFCTFSGAGLVHMSADGSVESFTSEDGLASNRIRTCTELADGSMAVAVTGGVFIIKDGKIVREYTADSGLTNTEILAVAEDKDGRILMGSDGDGLFIGDGADVTRKGIDDGLQSEVIMRIKYDAEHDVFWLITSNSVAYMKNGVITTVTNFPFSNNFDLFNDGSGHIWVLSSGGIFVVSADNMLNNTPGMEYILYDTEGGLPAVATANSRSELTEDGLLYISGATGVSLVDLHDPVSNDIPAKLTIPFVHADDTAIYAAPGGTVTIPHNTKRLTIDAYVLSYTLMQPKVCYRLIGFDEEDIILDREDLRNISYTNLKGGNYTFTLSTIDDLTGERDNTVTLTIVKDMAFYEYPWFIGVALFDGILLIYILVTDYYHRKTRRLERKQRETRQLLDQVITAFAKCIDLKDRYTQGHSFRVAKYTRMIAEEMGGYSKEELDNFYNIALLHDIGKISIPDNVLNKPGKLTDEEFEIMKTHAQNGYDVLKEIKVMPELAIGAGFHHERLNGKGYPKGLVGDAIPKIAQIIAVADTLDAMYSTRPYRRQMPLEEVSKEIQRCVGTHYAKDVVDAFQRLVDRGEIKHEEAENSHKTDGEENV